MFGNSNKENGSLSKASSGGSSSVNTFGVGTLIEGAIKSEGDVRIDGKIIGTISSKAKVVVGSTGVIEGEIFCTSADISGRVTGKLQVKELLFLKNTAKINGDLVTNKLVVEKGAEFNGNCSMGAKQISHGEKITVQLEKQAV